MRVTFSGCASTLSVVGWRLINAVSGAVLRSGGSACSAETVSDVPAGDYRFSVTSDGKRGSYSLALVFESTQAFAVSLPVSVSDGVPAAGAGNLETAASEDVYTFSLDAAGKLQLDFLGCASSLGTVYWQLYNGAGSTVTAGQNCSGSTLTPTVPAGSYRLAITRPGRTGTYGLALRTV